MGPFRRTSLSILCGSAALGLALSAAGAADYASSPATAGQRLLLVDGSGQPVGVLVTQADAAMPAPMPDPAIALMAEMDAQQAAMMRQMQTDLAAFDNFADPSAGAVPADLVAMPQGGSMSSVSVSMVSGGTGCSRTVVWRQEPGDAAPKLVLDRVADRCGSGTGAPQAVTAQERAAPKTSALPGLTNIVDRHPAHLPKANFTPF